MKQIAWIVLGCMVLMTTALAGGDANKCLFNVWKGTIGKTPVMMEFHEIPNEDPVGNYYYRTSTVDLHLLKDTKGTNQWIEFDQNYNVTGRLHLICTENTLSGEWKSPDGKKSFNIQAGIAKLYSESRLNAEKLGVIKHGSFGTHQYEIIGVKELNHDNMVVEGLRLLGESKGIQKINNTLLEKFQDALTAGISCTAGKLKGGSIEFGSIPKVIFWNDDFIGIGISEGGYCGEAPHPYSGGNFEMYNLLSGDPEDASQWLTKPYRMGVEPSTDLGNILSQAYLKQRGDEDGKECLEASSFSGSWPTDEGFTFSSFAPYAISGCNENITIPYNVVWPYLTPLGQSHAKSFRH